MQEPRPDHAPAMGVPAARNHALAGAAPAPESRLQAGSLRLFRVAGIDVLLHWSWFPFALVPLQSSGDDALAFAHYDAQIWYVIQYVALFVFVLLHEFGHVLACRSVGGIANTIVLWPLGGLAYVEPPSQPGAVLWSIAAGPLVNVLLLAPTLGIWLACSRAGLDQSSDLYRFAGALAWTNGYLLVFNILPVFPLDGGRMLQALLWFVMSRTRSLQVASGVGLLTTLGLLTAAIVQRSLVWGIMAGFGVLFSLIGLQAARGLGRMLRSPRRPEAACPDCGAAPPIGNFWLCQRCWMPSDVFANNGMCPNCGTPAAAVLCADCGASRPYAQWHGVSSEQAVDRPVPPAKAGPRPSVGQRIVWGAIFGVLAMGCCGLNKAEEQPLGLIVWAIAGVVLGAMSAGTMSGMFKNSQQLRKLRGAWRLVEVDGQNVSSDAADARQLVLNYTSYEERVGDQRCIRGTCWTDTLAEPPALSFTPKAGPDAGKPRQGIYRLEGDTLTICLAYPGRPRSATLMAQPEVQQLFVYRRGGKA